MTKDQFHLVYAFPKAQHYTLALQQMAKWGLKFVALLL